MVSIMDENKKEINSNALDQKCPNCNAKLTYKIELKKWKCDYCGSTYSLEELEKEKKEDNSEIEDDEETFVEYSCKDCGAKIVADEQTSATFCVYCGNTAILKNKLTGKFKPDFIIPFVKTEKDAHEAFKKVTKGKLFTPNLFKKQATIEKIRGIYIPFWLYSIYFEGKINVKATRVSSWTSGDTRYTKTDYYDLIREGNMNFNRVPVDGSTRFDDALMNSIEPFDYNELKEYNHAYLSGFLAEKYDVDKEKSYKCAESRVDTTGFNELFNTCVSYASKNIKNKESKQETKALEYALLPAYMVNVKYNNKYYMFAMNGQTGKFVGNIPVSRLKLILYFLLFFTISFILVLIISYLIFKGGA